MSQVIEQPGLPVLSVVVIGRNEGERLQRCLGSVLAMELLGYRVELIYVDSASTDGSPARAAAAGARVLALRPDRPTAALGRNAGWRAATGELVLFLDGDTVLHPQFVARALPFLEDSGTAVLWGHRRELHPERSVYNRVLDLDWIYPPGPAAFCGGDALFRRSVLEQTGGFDEGLIAGEEPELCRRILAAGYKVLHVDLPMTGHDLAISTLRAYWRRAERAGHAYAEIAARFRNTPEAFWSDEVRRNRVRALMLAGLMILGLLMSAALRSAVPLCGVALCFGLLALRTAWKARWKSRDWLTLVLYGVHSHVQQIPVFLGQMRFERNRRQGRQTPLVEYHQP